MERWLESAYTDGTEYFVSDPLPKKGDKINISFRVLKAAPVTGVILRSLMNGVQVLHEMKKDHVANGLQYYMASVTLYEDVFKYQIYIVTDDCVYFLTQRGITAHITDEVYDFQIITDYQQPSWVKGGVFYQIFPDRFCNGNPDNDVKAGEYVFNGQPTQHIDEWEAVPETYDRSFCLDFYGGDLEGIKAKIPYFKRLGVTALYLNPIFTAATVHKYDCLDYLEVDPHFGGDEALAALSKALHDEGMKLILDVSINHTGSAHRWFNKEALFFPKNVGAYNNPDAPEREYYFFSGENDYKSWYDVDTLPTLNYTSQALRDRLYRAPDSLVKKWLKPPYSIDGWRFDVADIMARNNEIQLHHEVWPQIRRSIKAENPQAYILAEDWGDCAEFMRGDEWDSPMNYFGCARPLREFAGETDLFSARHPLLRDKRYKPTAHHLAERIRNHFCKLPTVMQENQFNLFDSHDVPRLHNNGKVNPRHVRGVVITMFTLPGAANIYYGNEAGIDGWVDSVEGCRFSMPWSRDFESGEDFKLYSTLCRLKKENRAFNEGGFKILHEDDYVFACARFTPDTLMVAIFSTDDVRRELRIPLDHFGLTGDNPSDAMTDSGGVPGGVTPGGSGGENSGNNGGENSGNNGGNNSGKPVCGREVFGNAVCRMEGADAVITVEPHESYLFEFI